MYLLCTGLSSFAYNISGIGDIVFILVSFVGIGLVFYAVENLCPVTVTSVRMLH